MALSNAHGHLVLATGNKSELAVGYSTIYGDAVGGFAPIKDVPKTLVWRLARWRNAHAELHGETPPIPPNSISKPPSAELRPGQLDTDSLPDYEVLDAILERYVDGDQGVRRDRRRRVRCRARGAGGAARRRRRVEAAAVPARPEDQFQGVRQGSPPAHHQSLARKHRAPLSFGYSPVVGLVSVSATDIGGEVAHH